MLDPTLHFDSLKTVPLLNRGPRIHPLKLENEHGDRSNAISSGTAGIRRRVEAEKQSVGHRGHGDAGHVYGGA
jgi:hypothetical protein